MDTRKALFFALVILGSAAIADRQARGQDKSARPDTLAWRILEWSEAEQTAWVSTALDKGMPPDLAAVLSTLVLNKTATTLPLLERKIEQVLASASPLDCFTDKSVDPDRFVALAAGTIPYGGDEVALREAGKLIRIDEKRFGSLVEDTLREAERRNPYTLAYRGLELGDPAMEKRILAWAEARLADKTAFRIAQVRQWWAEAMVDKYGGVPTEGQWETDPIVSRVKPAQEPSFHNQMIGLAVEAAEKRARH
jgi:hypothetical protein